MYVNDHLTKDTLICTFMSCENRDKSTSYETLHSHKDNRIQLPNDVTS